MTEVPTSIDRPVDVEVAIAAPRDIVFEYLVDPDKLMRWMGHEGEIDAHPGGTFALRVTESDWAEGSYVEVEPPSRLVLTWGWRGSDIVPPGSSTVTFEVRDSVEGNGTVVRLQHTGLPAGQADEHEHGWNHFLGRLAVAAPGGDPDA